MSRRKQSHPKPVLKRDDSLTGEDMASETEDTMEVDDLSCTTPAAQHGSSDKESSSTEPSLVTTQSASSVSGESTTASTAKKRKIDQSTESAEEGESPPPPHSPAFHSVKKEPSDRDTLSESPQPPQLKQSIPIASPDVPVNAPTSSITASAGLSIPINSPVLPFNSDLFASLRYLTLLRNGLGPGLLSGLPDASELPLKSAISPSLPVPPAHLCIPCGIRFSSLSTLEAHQTYYCSHRIRQAAEAGNANTGNGTGESDSHTQDQESQVASKTTGSESVSEENRNLSSMLFEAMVGPPPVARVRRSGKYYTCPYCSFSADKRVSLNRHLRSHVGLPMLATTPVSPPPPPPMPPAPPVPPRIVSALHDDPSVTEEDSGALLIAGSSRADRYCAECDIQFNSIKTFRVHKQLYCRGKLNTLRSHLQHPVPSTSHHSSSPSTSSRLSAPITTARLIDTPNLEEAGLVDRQVSTPGSHTQPNSKENSGSWPMLILPTQPPILVPFHIVQSANFWPDHLTAPPQSLLVMPDGTVQGLPSPVPNHTVAGSKPNHAQRHSSSPDGKDRPVRTQPTRTPPSVSGPSNRTPTPSPTRSPVTRADTRSAAPSTATNLDGALDLSVKHGTSDVLNSPAGSQKSPTPEIDVAIATKCEVIIKMETASPQPPSATTSPFTSSPAMDFSSNVSDSVVSQRLWRDAKELHQGSNLAPGPVPLPFMRQGRNGSPATAAAAIASPTLTPTSKPDANNKCEDCNIAFHRYENYLIHKQHYCAGRNAVGTAQPRPPGGSPSSARHDMSVHSEEGESPDQSKGTLSSNKPCFQFICVTCGIKFGSLNNLKAHQTYYCSRSKDPESQHAPATSPMCPTTARTASTSSTITDPTAAEAPSNLALSPIPSASPVPSRSSETESIAMAESLSANSAAAFNSNSSTWKCPCCGVVCTSLVSAQKHIESHPNIRAFRCTLCGYRGNTLRGMRTHVRTLHFERKSADMQEENYIACIFQNESSVPTDSTSPTRDFPTRITPTTTSTSSASSSNHPFSGDNLHPFNLMADFNRLFANNGAEHSDLASLAGAMPPEFALQMEAYLARLQHQHPNGDKMLIPPAFLNSLGKPPSTGVGCRSDKLFLCDLCCYSSSYRGNVLRHAKLVHSRDLIDVPVVSPAFLQAQKLLNLRNLDLLAQSDKVLTSPEPLHVKIEPEGLMPWPSHSSSTDKAALSGNSNSSSSVTHNSHHSSNGSHPNNNNNTTKIELLSPTAATNSNTSPGPPRLVTTPGAVISPKLANGFPDMHDVAQKTCQSCNITFTYMSTFLAHKKYYCGSQAGNESAELTKSPSETPVQ